MNVVTMTVRLGLTGSSMLGIALLSVGGILVSTGLVWSLLGTEYPLLSLFLIAIVAVYLSILTQYWRLFRLSRRFIESSTQEQIQLQQEIVNIALKNPKWITLITQTIVLVCAVLLIGRMI